jgi:CheY-like chemotaxis protein
MVILLVDDDVHVQYFIWKLLKTDGFTILTAGDGQAALQASDNYPGTIDLLLSDVEMPRMGGLELCRNILAMRPGTKVLMMTGDLESRERVFEGGLPVLQKPFTPKNLLDSIEGLIGPVPAVR